MSLPPTGPTRRTLILAVGAGGIAAALGAPRLARAEPEAAPAQDTASEERPHRTLLGLI
ncbi:hypothetical protein AB0K52_21120 [Glycomyces sp. NPDC049804]|uniref:hypothetical protein n=1 Tax=Glycomyces sp. NPDC049804 TaxID=3154363 RepID=UPI003433270E